jgi:hypothetical protein
MLTFKFLYSSRHATCFSIWPHHVFKTIILPCYIVRKHSSISPAFPPSNICISGFLLCPSLLNDFMLRFIFSANASKVEEMIYRTTTQKGVSKSLRTGSLERDLQTIQLFATRCSCIAILWVCLVSFAVIILRVVPQRVFTFVSVYFVIDSVRKLLDTPPYVHMYISPL